MINTSKRTNETYSAEDRSHMLYSHAPSTQYYGNNSYQSIDNIRSHNQYEGNTDRLPQTNMYVSQQRGQVDHLRKQQDVKEQWRK